MKESKPGCWFWHTDEVEEAVVFTSVYRRKSCQDCGAVRYYRIDVGSEELDFVPEPWASKEAEKAEATPAPSGPIHLSSDAQHWFRLVVRDEIKNLYDDPAIPSDEPSTSLEVLRFEIAALREITTALGLNFDEIVKKETTKFEQARMDILLRHEQWTEKLLDQLDQLHGREASLPT